jgi:hypothetical protein
MTGGDAGVKCAPAVTVVVADSRWRRHANVPAVFRRRDRDNVPLLTASPDNQLKGRTKDLTNVERIGQERQRAPSITFS